MPGSPGSCEPRRPGPVPGRTPRSGGPIWRRRRCCWLWWLDGCPCPVLVVDLSASAVFCNQGWSAASGLSRAASMGLGWLSAIDVSCHQITTERVVAAGGRACEIAMVPVSDQSPRRTELLMEPLVAFDGILPGQGSVDALGWARRASGRSRTGAGARAYGRDDGAAEAFVAQLQRALDEHQQATTTIAALVIEVDPTPVGSRVEPKWEAGIDQAMVRRIEPLLGDLQTVVSIGDHKLAVLCEEVSTYREVIQLAELVVELSDDPPLVAGVTQALSLSLGIAFPHLPGEVGEAVLANAVGAARPGVFPGGEWLPGRHRNRPGQQRREQAHRRSGTPQCAFSETSVPGAIVTADVRPDWLDG